jgi:hypothetical protein
MLYTPDGGVTDPEWRELDRRLREGDGIHWAGDPRLWLGIGTVVEQPTGRTARRLEVWRDNEDGSTTMVAHWHPSEQFRVMADLAEMRADAPGHISVENRIDRHNDELQRKHDAAVREQMIEQLDHAIRLHVDRNNPRTKFFLGGRGGARA